MSVALGAQARELETKFPDPQPFSIWALEFDTLIVNCPKARRAFVIAIGIA